MKTQGVEIFGDRDYCNEGQDICEHLRGLAGINYKCKHYNVRLTFYWVKSVVEKCDQCKDAYQKELLKRESERA